MKFNVLNRFSGDIQFTAEIECAEDAPTSIKLGLAVRWAAKTGASLNGANLDGASLVRANLDGASLVRARLVRASLNGASLNGANLNGASLNGANLDGANLDFSAWPLHCGSKNAIADDRLVSQLLFHVVNLDVSRCSGGVQEAVEYLRQMAVCNLFPEYRTDTNKRREFEVGNE